MFLYDGHGSTRGLVDALGFPISSAQDGSGQPVIWLAYDAYGQALNFAAATALTTLLYSGEHLDSLTNLQYLRARWYDPSSGRFTRLDPAAGALVTPISIRGYLYAAGNPISYLDPSGKFFIASTVLWGSKVHREIGADFVAGGPGRFSDVSINRILGTASPLGNVRPDLTDTVTGEVYEIKPVGSEIAGAAQLASYVALLNALDPAGRAWKPGLTYLPPPVIPLETTAIAIVTPPVAGVIIYYVLDMREVVAWVAAYTVYRLYVEITTSLVLAPVPVPI